MTDHAPTEPLDLDQIEARANHGRTDREIASDALVDVPALCRALRGRDAEIARLRDLVADVAHCGVESDLSPRYMVVQVDCVTWAELQQEAQA